MFSIDNSEQFAQVFCRFYRHIIFVIGTQIILNFLPDDFIAGISRQFGFHGSAQTHPASDTVAPKDNKSRFLCLG